MAPRGTSLLLVAAAAAATTPDAPPFLHGASALRVGVYTGGGISPASAGGYLAAAEALVARGTLASAVNYTDADVEALSLRSVSPIDVLVVPGGYSPDEGAAMTPAGLNAVRTFVASGGGYVSSCAGSYLAGTFQCCHNASVLDYCSVPGVVNATTTGCYATPWSIGLIPLATLNPWDRGHGNVTMVYTDAAIAALHLDPATYSGRNYTVVYWQGFIVDPVFPRSGYASLATYTSEIHSLNTNLTKGMMVGTPALINTGYGAGRVMASSPHPEMTDPLPLDIIAGYILWAGGVY